MSELSDPRARKLLARFEGARQQGDSKDQPPFSRKISREHLSMVLSKAFYDFQQAGNHDVDQDEVARLIVTAALTGARHGWDCATSKEKTAPNKLYVWIKEEAESRVRKLGGSFDQRLSEVISEQRLGGKKCSRTQYYVFWKKKNEARKRIAALREKVRREAAQRGTSQNETGQLSSDDPD